MIRPPYLFLNAAGEDVTDQCRVDVSYEGGTQTVTITNNTEGEVYLETLSGGAEAMREQENQARDAEVEITKILARLEVETDSTVESIGIVTVDVTDHASDRAQLLQRVAIGLKRRPGSRWA